MPRSGCSRVKLVDHMSLDPVHSAADAENKNGVARSLLPYTENKGTVSLWNRKLFSQKWGSFCTTKNWVHVFSMIRTLTAVNFLSLSKWGHQNDLKAAACILWWGGSRVIFSTRSNSHFMARREHEMNTCKCIQQSDGGICAYGCSSGVYNHLSACYTAENSRNFEGPFKLFNSAVCDLGSLLIWHACSSIERL